MRKSLIAFMIVVLPVFLAVSCNSSSSEPAEEKKTYKIGDRGPAGGYVFYINPDYEEGSMDEARNWKYLEAASSVYEKKLAWGPEETCYGCQTTPGSGRQNMEIFKQNGIEKFPAAEFCSKYNEGGDSFYWFLPSVDELDLMYKNLKVKYTAIDWKDDYWTSSEYSLDNVNQEARGYDFSKGEEKHWSRSTEHYVHPIRAFE